MQITHDNDCEHRLGHDCTCGASSYQFDLAAARAENKRLKRDLEITHNSRNELAETWKDRAIKAEAERDEARSMLADTERDMRQRAADSCLGLMTAQSARKFILALPLKHADRCTSHCIAERNK